MQQLQKQNDELKTKLKSVAAAVPRKPFQELGARQARRREKEGQNLIKELRLRSPSLVPIPQKRLNSIEDLSITLNVNLSWKQRQKLKSELAKKDIVCFSPTHAVLKLKNEEANSTQFITNDKCIYMENVEYFLLRRMERLFKQGC